MKKLLNRLFLLIGRLYDKKVDATGLALFRFFFSLNLIAEVATLYNLRQLVFGEIPYAESFLWRLLDKNFEVMFCSCVMR